MPTRSTLHRRARAVAYRDATAAELPWLVEEIDGVAEGAGADPLAVFAASVEEIWADDAVPAGRCSDLVGCAPATADGHVWVAHNNDLEPEREDELVALEWHVEGEPVSAHDRRRAVDQRRLQLRRPRADRQRALAERRPRRHPPAAAGARHPAPAHARRGGRGGAASPPGVVVQQPAEPPRRRRRERRGLGHRRRAAAAARTAPSPTPTTTRARGWPATSAIPRRSRARGRGSARRAAGSSAARSRRQLLRDALCDHTGAPDSLCRHTRARRRVEDCLLVHRRRHRRNGPIRSREPVRLPRAAATPLPEPHTPLRRADLAAGGRVGDADPVCVIPVATLEDHGYHLPIDTDVVIAETLAERAVLRCAGQVAAAADRDPRLHAAPHGLPRADHDRLEDVRRPPARHRPQPASATASSASCS